MKSRDQKLTTTVVQVAFSKTDVRAVKFVPTRRHVAVSCRGLPRITIREWSGSKKATDKYEAFVTTQEGREQFVTGRTEQLCYRRAVAQFWTS